jgi:DNA-binding transcriptional LysR family regulator
LRAGFAEVASWRGEAAARIVVGALPLSRAWWLPETIARFTKEYPFIDIAVAEGSYAELAGPLRNGEIDLVLGALRDDRLASDLAQEAVFEDRPALIMRAGHPLLSDTPASIAVLASYPWIVAARGTPLRGFWEAMFRECGGEPPQVRLECNSVLTIRHLLLRGEALALLSPDQVSVELRSGILAARPLQNPIRRQIGITTRIGWRPTAEQAAFLVLLRATGAQVAARPIEPYNSSAQ